MSEQNPKLYLEARGPKGSTMKIPFAQTDRIRSIAEVIKDTAERFLSDNTIPRQKIPATKA